MKKYLSLFLFLAMIITLGAQTAQAEEDGTVSGTMTADIEQKTDASVESALTPLQKKLKAEAELKARLKIQAELKDKRGEVKNEIKEKIDEVRDNIKTLREEAKDKMELLRESLKSEKDKAKLRTMEARIVSREKALERFDKVVEKLTGLKDRINAQIVKLVAQGTIMDVEIAKNDLINAQVKIDAAKVKITEANILLSASIDELSTENKAKLKTLAKEIQGLIREANSALNDAVKSLKEALKIKMEANAKVNVQSSGTTDSN